MALDETTHIIHRPEVLLALLKEANKTGMKEIQELPFRLSFVIENTYDSITATQGAWMNTIELTNLVQLLDGYDLSNVNSLRIAYTQGIVTNNTGSHTTDHYEMMVELNYVAEDGITFSHN